MIGPVYSRGKGRDLVLGLRAGQKHCNMRGTVHGGILATLADITIGYSLAFSTEPPTAAVTTNLTLDFLSGTQKGDWLGNCYITRGAERIARASAVFLVTGSL
ncbi:MAG TPA: PaaI family thioesterase [Burkholderiales bacterium]|nr:PaaI family thioesterase [Burkholderiales bacterium]